MFRAGILLILVLITLFLGRSFFVPDSFGAYGYYRGDSVSEERAHQVRHGGDASCGECHDSELAIHDDGVHKPVHCEVCHAPLATHVVDDEVVAPMKIQHEAALCLRCHRELQARRDDFPQIQPKQHVEEMGGEPGPESCFDCHDPHSPI